ncbi:MAG: DnaJ domain-containing protein [bacterium JZ-2024 1]
MKNYYHILKIYPTASQGLILEAYKARLQELTDGRSGLSEEEVSRMMEELNEAFEVLKDPGKRAQYDRLLLEQYMFGSTGVSGFAPATPPLSHPIAPPVEKPKKEPKEPTESIYEKLKKEQEEKIRDVGEFLGIDLTQRRAMLRNHSPLPEPVEAPSLEEISLDEAMALASSHMLDGKYEEALKILHHLEQRYEGDKDYPKILLRLGEMYNRFLKVPEKAVAYYRKLLEVYADTPEALLAEKRLEVLEPLSAKKKISLPSAEIVKDFGEVWKVKCPHCQSELIIPARKDIWFICPRCGEKFIIGGNTE